MRKRQSIYIARRWPTIQRMLARTMTSALALDRLGDYVGERAALQDTMRLDAKFAPVYNQLGFLQLKAGQTANAESNFKTAIALDPQYAEAQSNLGVLYGQQGNPGRSRTLVRGGDRK